MKTILFLTLLLPCITYADVNVSGFIDTDTIWSQENGVYVLQSTVIVTASTTLTILPGTIIKGKNGGAGALVIQGILSTLSGSSSPIILTSYLDDSVGGDTNSDATSTQPLAQDWRGVVFEQGSIGNLDNIKVMYAGYGGFGAGFFCGIENSGGILSVTNSSIISNGSNGICNRGGTLSVNSSLISFNATGISILAGTTTVSSTSIENNSIEGIHSVSIDPLILIDNHFINNQKTAFIDAAADFTHSGNTSADITKRGFALAGFPKDGSVWHTTDLPFILSGVNLWVQPGRTLTILPGSIIKIDSGTNLLVFGNLIAQGSPQAKIYFTSYKDDSVGGDTNGDGALTAPAANDWQNLNFQASSTGQLSNTVVVYGGQASDGSANIFNGGGQLSLSDMLVASSSQNGIQQNSGSTTVTNVEFSGNSTGARVVSGSFVVTQSKFSNNTSFGLVNVGSSQIDAQNNWWQSVSGPKTTSGPNATSTGQRIGGNILFTPWIGRDPSLPNPVIIIPGIMGSYLNDQSGNEIWMDLIHMALSSDSYLDALSLDLNGQSINQLIPGDIIRNITALVFSRDLFGGLIEKIKASGYIENTDLFVFPYDWRIDLQFTAIKLREKIEQIKLQTGAQRITVIAHSMGGLLFKEYLRNFGASSTERFIDIATPHLGSPKSAGTLLFGDTDIRILNRDKIKLISQNMPSVYELLPSRKYLNNSSTSTQYYIYNGLSANQRLDFDETKTYLENFGRNQILIDKADTFHQEIDDLDPSIYGVKTYNIVGCGTPTIGQFYILDKKGEQYNYNIRMINGDGTVPLRSAEAMPAFQTFYTKNAQHATIPSTSGVKELVIGILSGNDNFDISPYSNLSATSTGCTIPNGQLISFHSPITLDIYDSSGNHTGLDANSDIENNIPGVVYEVIDDNKFAFLPDGVTYTVRGTATSAGTFDARVETITDGEVSQTTLFTNIPLTTTTQTALTINSAPPPEIALDNDNNGTYEMTQSVSTTTIGFLEGTGNNTAELETKTSIPFDQTDTITDTGNSNTSATQTISVSTSRSSTRQFINAKALSYTVIGRKIETKASTSTVKTLLKSQASVSQSITQPVKAVFKRLWSWFINKL